MQMMCISYLFGLVATLESKNYKQTPVQIGPSSRVDRLIDCLTKITDYESFRSIHSLSIETKDRSEGFLAAQALVKAGVEALPALIAHLSDSRKTNCTIIFKNWRAESSYAHFYEPRYRETFLGPSRVEMYQRNQTIASTRYTFLIGDLCYGLIGDIVNRRLLPLDVIASKIQVINSPVHNPQLIKWVKSDWSDLSRNAHIEQLEQDVIDGGSNSGSSALQRLLYYYPASGEKLAKKLLNRTFYDEGEISHLVFDQLLETNNADEWKTILDNGKARLGASAYEMIPTELDFYAEPDRPFEPQRSRAAEILKLFFPKRNPYEHKIDRVANFDDMGEVVLGAENYLSKTLDLAIQRMFRRALLPPIHPLPNEDSWETRRARTCVLAQYCATRLIGKGYNREYQAFFENYLHFIKTKATKDWEKSTAKTCEEWIAKLKVSN